MIWAIRLCLFLLPFALLWAWLRWRKTRTGTQRLSKLTLALVLAFAALLGMGLAISLTESGAPGARYIPATEVDGKIVPGRFESRLEGLRP